MEFFLFGAVDSLKYKTDPQPPWDTATAKANSIQVDCQLLLLSRCTDYRVGTEEICVSDAFLIEPGYEALVDGSWAGTCDMLRSCACVWSCSAAHTAAAV